MISQIPHFYGHKHLSNLDIIFPNEEINALDTHFMIFQQWFNISRILIHVARFSTFAVDLRREDSPARKKKKEQTRATKNYSCDAGKEITVKNDLFLFSKTRQLVYYIFINDMRARTQSWSNDI